MKFKYFSFLLICFFTFQLSAQQEEDLTEEEIESSMNGVSNFFAGNETDRVIWDSGTMGFGISSYLADGSGFSMPTMYNFLDQKHFRSGNFFIDVIELGLGLMPKDRVQKIRFHVGTRYSLVDYHFERAFRLEEDKETFQAAIMDVDKEIKRSRLHVHSLQIPLMLKFRSNPESSNKSINFAIGYVYNLRFASNFKIKFEDKEKLKVKDDFNLRPSLGMVEGRIGVGAFNFYVQYGLDYLFADDRGPMVTPINIGITSN